MEDKKIEITIFASRSKYDIAPFGIINYGHSFLSFKNNSEDIITVAGYPLQPNEEITIGTWPLSSNFGLWFNVESSLINHCNKYADRVSLTQKIPSNLIKEISDIIIKYRRWSIFKNCTYFALNVWNEIFDDKLLSGRIVSPKRLYLEILKNKNYLSKKPVVDNQKVGYYKKLEFINYSYGKAYVED